MVRHSCSPSVDRLPARLAIPTIVALSLALWALTLAIRRKSRRRARQFHPPTAIASGRRLVRGRGGKTCAGRAGDLLLGSRRPKDSAAHDQSADDAENRTTAATRQNGLICCNLAPVGRDVLQSTGRWPQADDAAVQHQGLRWRQPDLTRSAGSRYRVHSSSRCYAL